MKKKIVFFGAGPYLSPILDSLRNEYDLALIVTTENETGSQIISYSRKNNIRFVSVKRIEEYALAEIKNVGADIAVLAYFGIIVPQNVVDIFPLGIINIHPSLLPKYRGPTPGQTAILNGDKITGVSIMKLDNKVDHGPVLASIEEPIREFDNSDTLYQRLFSIGANLLIKTLEPYIQGQLKPVEQNETEATFTDRFTKNSGFIDINNPQDKETINRMIRAYYPWPNVWFKTKLNEREKFVKLLPNGKIQVEGKNNMLLKDFGNGYPEGQEILNKLNLNG